MRIGQVLEQARRAPGSRSPTVEERTKIRAKYLRALEAEDWDDLPEPAYARASCAPTRSSSGSTPTRSSTSSGARSRATSPSRRIRSASQVLERRRRPAAVAGRRRSRALASSSRSRCWSRPGSRSRSCSPDDDEPKRARASSAPAGQRAGEQRGDAIGGNSQRGAATVKLAARGPQRRSQVCLLGGGGEALIDGQVLPAGDTRSSSAASSRCASPRASRATSSLSRSPATSDCCPRPKAPPPTRSRRLATCGR